MKKAFKVFAIGFVAILLVALVIGLLLPSRWEAGATVDINAEPAIIHEYVSSFENWQKWATDAVKTEDPTAVVTISEDGRSMSWKGERMGRGRMSITRDEPGKGIWYEAAIESDEVNGSGHITYERVDGITRVTWHDEGKLPPVIGGYFAAMVNQALSDHFAKSLAKLKTELEGA